MPIEPSSRCYINYRGFNVSLQLKSVYPGDSGNYTLVAENQFGTVTSHATLIVEPMMKEKKVEAKQQQQQQQYSQRM